MESAYLTARLLRLLLLATFLHHVARTAGAVPEVVFQPDTQASHGAVASEDAECSAIGRDLLARGVRPPFLLQLQHMCRKSHRLFVVSQGNAVDALVGTTFCVGVVGMYHSGIGGGGFAMIRDAAGGYEAVDFRETAPAAAHEDMYQGNVNGSVFGGLAVGVPSEVLGLEYIHKKYGVLPWNKVMRGAIHVARDGFRGSYNMEASLRWFVLRHADAATSLERHGAVHGPGWGAEGAQLPGRRPELRRGLCAERHASGSWGCHDADAIRKKIADEGADALYAGELAEAMIECIQQANGTMTLADLANYTVVSRPVKTITYRGLGLHTVGAPASGAVTLGILKTMEQFDLAEHQGLPGLAAHRFTEAMRFGYGARVGLGDPDHVDGVRVFEDRMLSDGTARRTRGSISDDRTQPVHAYDPEGIYTPDSHGTSHIVTADASGMATSLTTTINLLFGARLMDPASGIVLNNEMNDFSIPGVPNEFGFQPSTANYIRPGKRPLSSITPVIATHPRNGSLYATVGAAGGSRIISATAVALWHLLEHGMGMRDALREPRLHDQLMPNTVLLEYKFDNDTAAALAERGHNVTWVAEGLSAVQGIRILADGTFEAAGEPRQKNSAGLTL
ncbi:Gamma-glutamyltranspeptidase 1 [Tolypocladium capitatum]|uniref:Glutathione hydrolase n=1 Tax=Tolypocladium capitatum TaxID=45235 RepID=A0A2K3QIH4_9HYPO|nr:Gamma-glutamyltranspeptidase 1 [Tolypocladium capitatum]